MKRSGSLAQERASKKASKSAGMGAPGGSSKYAAKKRGEIVLDGSKMRPSWMSRAGYGWRTPTKEPAREHAGAGHPSLSEPSPELLP